MIGPSDREIYMGKAENLVLSPLNETWGNAQATQLAFQIVHELIRPRATIETVKEMLKANASLSQAALLTLQMALNQLGEDVNDRQELLEIVEARSKQGF